MAGEATPNGPHVARTTTRPWTEADIERRCGSIVRRAQLADRELIDTASREVFQRLAIGDGRWGEWLHLGRRWPKDVTVARYSRPCAIEGCQRLIYARGVCQAHYAAVARRTGTPHEPVSALPQEFMAPAHSMFSYAARPSAWCLECGTEFSDVVGREHAQRLSHHLRKAP